MVNLKVHAAKTPFVSQGIKLSAEVKPFVPKYSAVTVAWSEPSEACVFPRYYTTCYPYIQEPPVDKYVPSSSHFLGEYTKVSRYIKMFGELNFA